MATRDVTLRHRGAIPPLPNSTGALSLFTRASITFSRWRRSANNMLHDFIIIGQSNIPISTATPTHYVRIYTHTHFLYISKIFGPFLGAPGALALYFPIPLLPLRIHIFFPTFQSFSSLPSSRFPRPSTSRSSRYFTYVQQVLPTSGPSPIQARILFHLKDAYATISPYFQPPNDY